MCIEELSNSSWDGLCIGNRKPHAHKMHWGGGVSQSHLLPVLCPSSGADRNTWVWQRGLPCQSLRTSPRMVPHLRYRLHHLQRFCLACREWRGSASHEQAKSESRCNPFFLKTPCLWSFRKQEKLLSVLSLTETVFQNAVHLVAFSEEAGETLLPFGGPCYLAERVQD